MVVEWPGGLVVVWERKSAGATGGEELKGSCRVFLASLVHDCEYRGSARGSWARLVKPSREGVDGASAYLRRG